MTNEERETSGIMMAIMMEAAQYEKAAGIRPNKLIVGIEMAGKISNDKSYPPPTTVFGMRVVIDTANADTLQVAWARNVAKPMSFEDIKEMAEEDSSLRSE